VRAATPSVHCAVVFAPARAARADRSRELLCFRSSAASVVSCDDAAH
jgi:hypothetical protein